MNSLKEKLVESLDLWLEERVDEMLRENPAMAVPAVYIKRGCHNMMVRYKEKIDSGIDKAALFLADEKGEINADTVFEDVMGIFKGMEEKDFDMGILKGTVGKGKAALTLPDNILTDMIFGSKKTLTFGEGDFRELKELVAR